MPAQIIYGFTVITVLVSSLCASTAIGFNQGRLHPSSKSIGTSSSGIGQRVTSELKCTGDNLYYRGRQTGSRGLLPRVREDLINRVLATVRNTNDLAEKMILAIRDGTLDLAIARQLDQTREIVEIPATTTTTEGPDVPEPLLYEQSGEFAILDDYAVATMETGKRVNFTEKRSRPIGEKFARQIVVPVVSFSSEEESAEDNSDRRSSRRRCFYNRLLDDVSTIDGEVGTAAGFLRAYEYNKRRRRRNRVTVTSRPTVR